MAQLRSRMSGTVLETEYLYVDLGSAQWSWSRLQREPVSYARVLSLSPGNKQIPTPISRTTLSASGWTLTST